MEQGGGSECNEPVIPHHHPSISPYITYNEPLLSI
jgi:hypothetical protein